MFEQKTTEPKGLRAIDWAAPVDAVQAAIAENFGATEKVFKELHGELRAGTKTLGEVEAASRKAAADLGAIDLRLAEVAARVNAHTVQMDGSDSELRQFVVRPNGDEAGEVVRLWGGPVSYRGQEIGRMPGLLDSTETYGNWHAEVKAARKAIQFTVATKAGRHEDPCSLAVWRAHAPKSFHRLCYLLQQSAPDAIRRVAGPMVEKIFSNVSGSGASFIPTEMLIPELEKDLKYSSFALSSDNIERRAMDTAVVTLPFVSGIGRPYKYGAGSTVPAVDFNESGITDASRTITPSGLAHYTLVDRDAVEDSIVAAIPELQAMIVRSLTLAREDAFVNGDTTSTHQDAIASWNPNSMWSSTTGAGGSSDHRRAFYGLRAIAFDIGATAKLDVSTSFTTANLLALAGKMSPPHGVEGDLMLIAGYDAYLSKILGLTEVLTLDQYGTGASILTGEVARIGPWSVVRTPFLAAEMAATGLYTGSGALSTMVGVNRSRYRIYQRRGAMVELQNQIRSNSTDLVAHMRETLHSADIGTAATSASPRNVVAMINI